MPAPGTGFGYAVMGTDAFGDLPATAAFVTKIGANDAEPIVRFVYDGFVYDDYVIDAPTIMRGGDIIAGTVNIVLSNADQTFNIFVADRINTMGKHAHIGLWFDGTLGYLYLMTGIVEDVSYNAATITLSIRDAMAPMLEKRMGSGPEPVDYYTVANAFNPATLVWQILTEEGELDSTESSFNTQIDYASWQAWQARCTAHSYRVRGRFPGTTIQNALLRIAELTHSFFWVDGEGFFKFAMFEPPHLAGGGDETYDSSNSVSIDIDIDKSTVKNIIKIYFGHDPDAEYGPGATISSRNIAFNNDNPDSINISNGGFLKAGFDTNDPVTVSGSEKNDGNYGIETITSVQMTMFESNGLTEEVSGASVTLSQNQNTVTMTEATFTFDGGGNPDTIVDSGSGFIAAGFNDDDSITISGSTLNDGTYLPASVTSSTITMQGAVSLANESAGAIITITQQQAISLVASTIAFNDNETGGDDDPPDTINKSDGGLLTAGFDAAYQVTVAGSASNDGTYRLASVTGVEMELLKQTLIEESSGEFVTITQTHSAGGIQWAGVALATDTTSRNLFGDITLTDDNKVVWHDTEASAAAAAAAKLLIFKYPGEFTRIVATMIGFLSSITDEIHVTESHKAISDQTYYIKEVDIDLETGLVDILAERGN